MVHLKIWPNCVNSLIMVAQAPLQAICKHSNSALGLYTGRCLYSSTTWKAETSSLRCFYINPCKSCSYYIITNQRPVLALPRNILYFIHINLPFELTLLKYRIIYKIQAYKNHSRLNVFLPFCLLGIWTLFKQCAHIFCATWQPPSSLTGHGEMPWKIS